MLTQLSTVKTRLEIKDASDDTILTNALNALAGRFDKECNRTFARTVNAVFEFDGDKTEIVPPCFPIESISLFETMQDFASGWVAVDPTPSYLVRKGSVISLADPLDSNLVLARVTYTGGFVLPGGSVGAGQTALPSEIEQACIEQCCYWYQNRKRKGIMSISTGDGSLQQFAQLDLLPEVKALLAKYVRWLP